MTISLELRCAPVLTIRAAVIEHMRWNAYNIPSTPREIADEIGRNLSSVRRVIRELAASGAMIRINDRVMLSGAHNGARLLT